MADTDMLYMASLEKRNEELGIRIAELEDKHHNECGQIAHYDDELKAVGEIARRTAEWGKASPVDFLDLLDENAKMKELLKAAVEDFAKLDRVNTKVRNCMMPDMDCADCPLSWDSVDDSVEPCHNWRYTNEALALIGEDTNVPASADDTNVGHKSGGWISCKDYMPDTLERGLSTMYSDCCLVCDAFGWIGMAYYKTDGQKSWWEFADAQNKNKIDWTEVTHWQLLPEPPKDGDTNG